MIKFVFYFLLFAQSAACSKPSQPMTIIAHRGASGVAPESTLIAYEKAFKLSVDYLEGDIQRTKDGVLVLFHDEFLSSDTNIENVFPDKINEPIEHFTWEELQQLSSGKWFNIRFKDLAQPEYDDVKILKLEDLLKRMSSFKGSGLYLETKRAAFHPGIEIQLIQLLTKYGWTQPVPQGQSPRLLFQSFEKDSLMRLQQLAPQVPRVLLVSPSLVNIIGASGIVREAKSIDAYGVGPAGHLCWPWNMSTWHEAGLVVHAYTLNKPWQYRLMSFLGVDGIFTDHPQRLVAFLGEDQ